MGAAVSLVPKEAKALTRLPRESDRYSAFALWILPNGTSKHRTIVLCMIIITDRR